MAMKPPIGAGQRLAHMTETFFAEAAVLVFILPAVDRVVSTGLRGLTKHLILGSVGLAVVFFLAASLIAAYRED